MVDTQHTSTATEHEERRSIQVIGVGSALQSLCGAAAVVLTITGLSTSGEMAFYTTAIATILVGVGLISYGVSLAARFNELMGDYAQGYGQNEELGTGVTAEVLGGLAGIAMGVLALAGVAPHVLPPIVPVVFGAALLLSSGAVTEMNDLRLQRARLDPTVRQVTHRATLGAAGVQVLAGLAGVILGILAILGNEPGVLTEVGILCIGAALLFSGGAISTRMFTLLGRSF